MYQNYFVQFSRLGTQCLGTNRPCYFQRRKYIIIHTFLAHLNQRLIGELIGYPCVVVVHNDQTSSSSKPLANQSQILCGAFLGRGIKSVFAASGSHDPDGRRAHIWLKLFTNLLLQNRRADFHETWHVAFGTPFHHSLFKWRPWSDFDLFYDKVKFGNFGFSIEKSENSGFFRNYCSL